MTQNVKTRFAPSPTGYLHIGGVRTALFSWLYARHCGGRFLLRIEDTDRERSTPEAIEVILQGLSWVGLDWDEGPVFQTARLDRYREVAETLLGEGKAYHCYCTREELDAMRAAALAKGEKPRYDGRCRQRSGSPPAGIPPVVRFRSPAGGETAVPDLIQGRVTYRNAELDDLVLVRSDGTPTYNFSVVVDDRDMQVSHVIRGDDHLNNTPRQILIFQALGAEPPVYAHLPLILAADGSKLSKRHGTVSVLQFRDDGYLPEALLNYLVRLGWSHGDQEIFTMEEMVSLFDIRDVNKSAAAINPEKLLWLNQHYLKESDPARLAAALRPQLSAQGLTPDGGPDLVELARVQRERTRTLRDMAEQSRVFFQGYQHLDEKSAEKLLRPELIPPMTTLRDRFVALPAWEAVALHECIQQVADEYGLKIGKLAQPLRVAVTGTPVSPSIDSTLYLLGRQRSLAGLEHALEYMRRRVTA